MEYRFPFLLLKDPIDSVKVNGFWSKTQYGLVLAVHDVGGLAFDLAVYLGHALRDHQDLLWEIVGPEISKRTLEYRQWASNVIREEVSTVWSGNALYLLPRRRQIGIDEDVSGSFDRVSKINIERKELDELIIDTVGKGAALSLSDAKFAVHFQSSIDLKSSLGHDYSRDQTLREHSGFYLRIATAWARNRLHHSRISELEMVMDLLAQQQTRDSLDIVCSDEIKEMWSKARSNPATKESLALIAASTTIGTNIARSYVVSVPQLKLSYRPDDMKQASRLQFVWTAYTLGFMRSNLIFGYCDPSWSAEFPECPEFPVLIGDGIAAQFRKADERLAQENRGSVMPFVLPHILSAYALDPKLIEFPPLPLDMIEGIKTTVPHQNPASLERIGSTMKANVDEIDRLVTEFLRDI
jgi:hypothetical protein